MGKPGFRVFLLSILFATSFAFGQGPTTRDPRAVAVLQQSLLAMGGSVPTDTTATGKITIVEGSTTETGTIRVLTKGVQQTAEHIETEQSRRVSIFSNNAARVSDNETSKRLPLELSVLNQSPDFPLAVIGRLLTLEDAAFEYVGQETLDGTEVHHVRAWQTFAATPKLRRLAEHSKIDIFVDTKTSLVRKISLAPHLGGPSPVIIPLEVSYTAYTNVGGVLYPFRIEKTLNGTPWATITIDSVRLNSGLKDADFPVSTGRAQ